MPNYFEDIGKGIVKMTRVVNTDWSEMANKQMKKEGKGWSNGRTLRHVAEIPFDEVLALAKAGDEDAVMVLIRPTGEDTGAARRLLNRHPEWRCSEGSI